MGVKTRRYENEFRFKLVDSWDKVLFKVKQIISVGTSGVNGYIDCLPLAGA
jgi:hypothetical protein